jgi:hypothetical protein
MKTNSVNAAIFPVQQTGSFEDCHIKWAMQSFVELCDKGLTVPVKKVERVLYHASCKVHPAKINSLPEWNK